MGLNMMLDYQVRMEQLQDERRRGRHTKRGRPVRRTGRDFLSRLHRRERLDLSLSHR